MSRSCATWLLSQQGSMNRALVLTAEVKGALDASERGITASEKLTEGSELIRVPLRLCLHLKQGQTQAAVESALEQLSAQHTILATALLLLHELGKGSASDLVGWLKTLPKSHNCVFAWGAEEQAWLAGTGAELHGKTAQDTHTDVTLPLMLSHASLWPEHVRSFAAFAHALGMVQSRTFHLHAENWLTGATTEDEVLYMLPAIDMVNHSSEPAKLNASLALLDKDGRPVSTAAPDDSACFVLSAARDIAAGEEVLLSYGSLSDAQLLQIYGFVEHLDDAPGDAVLNPNNTVTAPLSALQQCCTGFARKAGLDCQAPPASERLQLVQSWGLAAAESVVPMQHGELADELVTVMQALLLPDDEWAELFPRTTKASKRKRQKCDQPSAVPAQSRPAGVFGLEPLMQSCESVPVCLALADLANKLKTRNAQAAAAPVSAAQQSCLRLRQAQCLRLREAQMLKAFQAAALAAFGRAQANEDEGMSGASAESEDEVKGLEAGLELHIAAVNALGLRMCAGIGYMRVCPGSAYVSLSVMHGLTWSVLLNTSELGG